MAALMALPMHCVEGSLFVETWEGAAEGKIVLRRILRCISAESRAGRGGREVLVVDALRGTMFQEALRVIRGDST